MSWKHDNYSMNCSLASHNLSKHRSAHAQSFGRIGTIGKIFFPRYPRRFRSDPKRRIVSDPIWWAQAH